MRTRILAASLAAVALSALTACQPGQNFPRPLQHVVSEQNTPRPRPTTGVSCQNVTAHQNCPVFEEDEGG